MKRLVKDSESIPLFDQILRETPLDVRVKVSLMMNDYANWDNGSYNGDMELLDKHVQSVIRNVKEWIKDGMPI